MRHLLYFCFILFLGISTNSQSQNTIEKFKEANALYQNEQYSNAITQYNLILEQSYTSSDLHYNLANSYYKTKAIPDAIFHYEKALKLNPSNEDAKHNLKIANQKTVDKIEAIPELFLYRWWKSIYNLFSADIWAKIVIMLLLISLAGFIGYLFLSQLVIRKVMFAVCCATLILSIGSWILAANQKRYLIKNTHGIIMNPTVDIISAPSSGSSQLFVLHEGTKVKLENSTKDWYEVSLPNGNKGWVIKEEVAIF